MCSLWDLVYFFTFKCKIPRSLQTNVVDLWYFKLYINLINQIILVLNVKGLRHQIIKIHGIENLGLQLQRHWVFATNSDFLIPISLKTNVVDLRYYKLRKTPSDCTVIGISQFEFAAKIQFLCCCKNSVPYHLINI